GEIDAGKVRVAEEDVSRAAGPRERRLLAEVRCVRRHDRIRARRAGSEDAGQPVVAAVARTDRARGEKRVKAFRAPLELPRSQQSPVARTVFHGKRILRCPPGSCTESVPPTSGATSPQYPNIYPDSFLAPCSRRIDMGFPAWRRVAATLSVVLVSVTASAPWSRAQAATATATAASGAFQSSTSFIDPFAGAGDIHAANQVMVIDSQGNTIVAGSFSGQINFGGGVLSSQAASPNKNIFLVKYSASGGFLWSKPIGGTNAVFARAVAVDSGGNIYITGM